MPVLAGRLVFPSSGLVEYQPHLQPRSLIGCCMNRFSHFFLEMPMSERTIEKYFVCTFNESDSMLEIYLNKYSQIPLEKN